MKQLSLVALILLTAVTAGAQFSKGDRYLGGSFQLEINDIDLGDTDIDNFYLSLAPSFTRFKSERRAFGFKLSAGYLKGYITNSGSSSETSRWNFGAGVFWQRLVLLGKGFYLSGEYGLNGYTFLGWQRAANPFNTYDVNTYGASLYFTPALGYKLTNRLLIGLQFNNLGLVDFSHEKTEYKGPGAPSSRKRNSLRIASSANNGSLGDLGINFAWKMR